MRLLLAEDERAISRAVAAILEKSHYSVDAVYDGKEALAYLEAGDYDGAILDIMMPGMDGISVLTGPAAPPPADMGLGFPLPRRWRPPTRERSGPLPRMARDL